MTDYNQALAFFQALTGEYSPTLTWQTFCDPDLPADWVNAKGEQVDYLAEWWRAPFDADTVNRLAAKQQQGAGVFFGVNGSSTGGRYAKEIDQFRAMIVDSDGAPKPAQWPYPPHVIIERDPTHWHAYWFIDGNTDAEGWAFAQYQLALWFGGDTKMINPDRVMRVPGFIHQKNLAEPHTYDIVYFAPTSQRYNLMQLMSGYQLVGDKAIALSEWARKRTGQGDVHLADYNDSPANVDKYRDYLLNRAEHGIDGQGRNGIRFKTACAGRDYALSPEKTIEMMLELWDHGNTPPCGPALIETSVKNAYNYASNRMGARSLQVWLDQPILLPPGASPTPIETVHYVVELPPAKAQGKSGKMLEPGELGDGYSKNHFNNSMLFIQQNSPNGEIFLYNEETYIFNGKVFDRVEPVVLEQAMLKAMGHMSPSMSDLSGSVRMTRIKLAASVDKMPAWRNNPDRNTDGTMVFNNGILDLNTNTFSTHDVNLLTNNILSYDYDPAATCPNWERFTQDLWGQDPETIRCFRQWMGYCMVRDYRHQKIAALIGKPRSGKGTIARVMRELLGKFNVASPALAKLSEPVTLHAMSGKLLAAIPDASSVMGPGAAAVMETLKSISGNDAVTFDRKYLPASTEEISARIMLIANEFPQFNDASGAIVDRILYFPFDISHAGREDPDLTGRLLAELPGIAIWAIHGLLDLREQGRFTESETTRLKKRRLRCQLSPALSFANELLEPDSNTFIDENVLYQRYVGWCRSTGTYFMSRDQLGRAMESAVDGIYRVDMANKSGYKGVRFKQHDNAPEQGSI